jgi:hypothetical protein
VGETLAETRVEVAAQRADNQRAADELEARVRRALDFKARFRENPALFIGLGVGTAFLVVGGPRRVAQALRRRMRPSTAEQAYDALPKSMQAWVDALAAEVGPKAGRARDTLIEELQHWRREPIKNKKARRELAKAMVEGPPGPSRTAWKAAEAGLTLLSAALARRAIEAFITGEPAGGRPAKPSASKEGKSGARDAEPPGYSAFSGGERQTAP